MLKDADLGYLLTSLEVEACRHLPFLSHHLRLQASLQKHDIGFTPDAELNQLVEYEECSAPMLYTQHCWQSDYESAIIIFLFYFLMFLFVYIYFYK